MERTGRVDPLRPSLAFTPATEQIAWNMAASAIATWVVKDEAPDLEGTLVTLDTRTWASQTHRLIWRPQCPACGDPQDGAETVAHPIELESRRKTFTSDGGHRAMTPEATIERFQQHVSPITGVVSRLERTSLSQDGVMLAYSAGTNVARPPRTLEALHKAGVSMRSTTGGKGVTDVQAKASALCEALERNSGVYRGEEPRRRARFKDLDGLAIHPNDCMGFSERQYRERDTWNAIGSHTVAVPAPFDEDALISWTPVWSLTRGEARYLPTAFCFYAYPIPAESRLCIACSNGNAAGNTLEEAILQGFLELVERDSVALWWYNRLRRPAAALETFDEPYLGKVQAFLARSGRTMEVLDITSDLGIPTFVAVSGRHESPEQITTGFGAHLDPRIALLRAVTELNQLLLVLFRGSGALEKSGNLSDADPRAAEWIRTAAVADHPYLTADPAQAPRTASSYAGRWSEDLRDDVRSCQALVERHGMEFLVLDQTRPDIGLPVVKVFVPGLRHFWRRLAPGRLYDVPVRLGCLPAPLGEEEMNPIGIFT
jgi:ribosomal protein S12 methylthiotransferase accessory factor